MSSRGRAPLDHAIPDMWNRRRSLPHDALQARSGVRKFFPGQPPAVEPEAGEHLAPEDRTRLERGLAIAAALEPQKEAASLDQVHHPVLLHAGLLESATLLDGV